MTGAGTSGTVSVVDPIAGKQTASIKVGLQPTALKVSGSTLFVANSNSDSVSVINTANSTVAQTFNVAPLPGSTVGSNPNAIDDAGRPPPSGERRPGQRARGLRYNGPTAPVQYEGLIPTDWYPVNVQVDPATGKIIVTNDKGIGARGAAKRRSPEGPDAKS